MVTLIQELDLLAPLSSAPKERYVRAEGASYWTEDGKTLLDLNEMCVVLGQNNDAFNQSMEAALRRNTTLKGENAAKEQLYRYLHETTHGAFRGIHLSASGSETVENAVRLAKKLTGRTEILSFWNSIHGRTYLSASLSGAPKRKTSYGPLAPGVVFLPYPNCPQCPLQGTDCRKTCLAMAESIIKTTSAQDAAAVIVELWQANGVILPPEGYLQELQAWAKREGLLFIVDEIQTGMGRSGSLYRYQAEGLDPDMLLLGKALGNGLHISALLTKTCPQAEDLHVFAGGAGDDPLACAAACEVFRQLENGLLSHVNDVGALLGAGLQRLQRYASVVLTQGAGLAASVAFTSPEICRQVTHALYERGFLVGSAENLLFCKPPYVVTEEEIGRFLAALEEILQETDGK